MKNLYIPLFFILSLQVYSQPQEPQIVLNPNGHSGKIRSMYFTPDGKNLISFSEDKSIQTWQVNTGELINTLYTHLGNGPQGMIFATSIHPDHQHAAVAGFPVDEIGQGDNYILIFNLETNQLVSWFKAHHQVITDLVFSGDGQWLASGDSQGKIYIWNTTNLNEISMACEINMENAINDLDFAPGKNRLAIASENKYFHLYDIFKSTGSCYARLNKSIDKHYYPVRTVKFSPDSSYLVSGGRDNLVHLFTGDGKFIRKIDEMPDPVSCIAFSSDGRILVVGSENQGMACTYTLPGFTRMAEFQDHNNTVTSCTFYPVLEEGNYLVATAGGNDNEIFLWNPLNARTSQMYAGKGNAIWNISFSENFELLVSSDKNAERFQVGFNFENLNLREVAGIRIASFPPEGQEKFVRIDEYSVRSGRNIKITNDPGTDGRLLSIISRENKTFIGSDFSLKEYNQYGSLIREYVGHHGGVRSLALTNDGRYLASAGEDQVIHLWNLTEDMKQIYPFVSLFISKDKQWVCWTPKGYFGCSDQGSKYFGWYLDQGMDKVGDFFGADQYFDVLYRPEEVKQSIRSGIPIAQIIEEGGEKLFDLSSLDKPSMALFKNPYTEIGNNRSLYLNQTRSKYFLTDQQTVWLEVEAYDGGGGIKELKVYQNDKLVGIEKDVSINQDREAIQKQFSILLLPGDNHFKVTAVNFQLVESRPDDMVITYTGEMEAISDLYIFSIGLNKYMNSNYDLNYARSDAESITGAVEEKAKTIFRKIHTTMLLDDQVTAENIRKIFTDISLKADLNDVFLFYYAGHGTIDQQSDNKEYYLVPYDVVQLYGNSQVLKTKGISAIELRDMLAGIRAQKQLILLDACHSGGAVQALAMRGAPEEKAIIQLARSSGIVLIAASGTKQFATEFEVLKHGAFTYVLLEALSGKADGGNKDQKITVGELKSYMEDRVPQITSEYGGSMQFPTGFSTGQDFPLSVVVNQ